jgi:hypothetical protein
MCGVGYGSGSRQRGALGRRQVNDPERQAVARYKLESQGLLRDHKRLATQLELVDRALERCSDWDRQEELRAQRVRITEVMATTRQRLRACWERARINARRAE